MQEANAIAFAVSNKSSSPLSSQQFFSLKLRIHAKKVATGSGERLQHDCTLGIFTAVA
jgi:hypothetical protein